MSDEKQGRSMRRRVALKVLGTGVPAAAFAGRGAEAAAPGAEVAHPGVHAAAAAQAAAPAEYTFQFLTADEQSAARILADLILPADERSGSATEAGAVEYMDEYAAFWGEPVQVQLRGGLRWLERECRYRFDHGFRDCDDAQRKAVLDDIAYPERLPPEVARAAEASVVQPEVRAVEGAPRATGASVEPSGGSASRALPLDPELERLRHGVAFFIQFKNIVQGGFYSSRIGIDDLGFEGNIPTEWKGCPPGVLRKIGVEG